MSDNPIPEAAESPENQDSTFAPTIKNAREAVTNKIKRMTECYFHTREAQAGHWYRVRYRNIVFIGLAHRDFMSMRRVLQVHSWIGCPYAVPPPRGQVILLNYIHELEEVDPPIDASTMPPLPQYLREFNPHSEPENKNLFNLTVQGEAFSEDKTTFEQRIAPKKKRRPKSNDNPKVIEFNADN